MKRKLNWVFVTKGTIKTTTIKFGFTWVEHVLLKNPYEILLYPGFKTQNLEISQKNKKTPTVPW